MTETVVDTRTAMVIRKIFADEELYRIELERVFGTCWLVLGHESKLPNRGDYFTNYMGEDGVIVCRDQNGKIDGVCLAAGGMRETERTHKIFDDPAQEVRAYVERGCFFPVNTLITLREDVVDQYPELPRRLYEAWVAAERVYRDEMNGGGEPDHMGLSVADLQQMGIFPTEYGFDANRKNIHMMIQYCYEQGLIPTLYEPEDLFHESAR
ncbi:MAG: hypothetical protein GEU73_05755 [Chloroflexi bacterium]|nr:hypothetical protein [Chloroflexota bacterium]